MPEEKTAVELLQLITERLLKETVRERRFRYLRLAVTFFIVLTVAAAGAFNALLLSSIFSKSSLSEAGVAEETYKEVAGGDPASKVEAKIIVLTLQGAIFSGISGSGAIDEEMVGKFVEQIHRQPFVRGIILDIKSPGGELLETDNVFRLLTTKLPKVRRIAYVNGIAASGGYYLALAGDEIVAHPLSLVGNVGVIMQTFNFKGLTDKLGVRVDTYKSGELKDMGNPFRDPIEKEQAIFQDSIMEMQQVFIRRITERRGGKINKKEFWQVKEGRIFSASEAKHLGLIDRELYFDDLLDEMLGKIDKGPFSKIKVVRYRISSGLLNKLFGSFFQKALGELRTPQVLLTCC